MTDSGVGIAAFFDNVIASANLLEQVSAMPVKYIRRLENDLQKVNAASQDALGQNMENN